MNDTANLDVFLDAALAHVPFDGWSEATFNAAATDLGLSGDEAKVLAPRGAVDLAIAYHRRGDQVMIDRMAATDLTAMRYSDRVAAALKFRIDAMSDREAVRRATTLFSLPNYARDGAKLIWETADHIWNALGDTSTDGNWYSKRVTLSAVWGSVVLYWLGDDSPGYSKTSDFIDRRIENVMQFEAAKSKMRENPLTKPLMDLQSSIMGRMRPPQQAKDVPGTWANSQARSR